jgi:hypothetical protein
LHVFAIIFADFADATRYLTDKIPARHRRALKNDKKRKKERIRATMQRINKIEIVV